MKRWPTKPLGELISIEKGKKAPVVLTKPTETSLRYLQIEDLRADTNLKFSEPFACPRATKSDVIIAWDGANAGTVSCNLDGQIGSTLAILRPFASAKLSAPFLSRLLEGKFSYLQMTATGATIPHISKGALSALAIPLPPLAEQERIVKLLDEADELRKLRAQADQRTAQLIPALFDEMFGKAKSTTHLISEVCESITDCVNRTAPILNEVSPYKMIRTTNVRYGRIDLSKVRYVSEETFKKWSRRGGPRKGDVILTREAPLGEVGLIESNDTIFLGQRLMQYRVNPKKLTSEFLLYAFLSPFMQNQMHSLGSGSTVEHLKLPDCRGFLIKVPPLELQQEFASRVAEIREMEAAQAASRQRLEDLFQSLLHRAFTGEL